MFAGLLGGALIGLAATLLWAENRRVAGVSGILRGALRASGQRTELLLFLGGLVAAGLLAGKLSVAPAMTSSPPLSLLAAAGLLVGFGTRAGGGCTSGHGVCGLSRFSTRSLAAVLTFMATAAITVFVVGHYAPGLRVR